MDLKTFCGDTITLSIPLAWRGSPFIPAVGDILIFTVKTDLEDADDLAIIQKATGAGVTFSGSTAAVSLVYQDSYQLAAGITFYDIQWQSGTTGEVKTLTPPGARLEFKRDATRLTTTSVPVYTTEAPIPGGEELTSYAEQVAALDDYPATFPPTIGSGADQAVAGNDSRLTNARTPTAHSHELDELDATAITAGKVLTSSGANTATWEDPISTVDNAAVNAAIAADPPASRFAMGIDDPAAVASVFNGQQNVAKRISTFRTGSGGSGSAPIRVFVYGDSYATGLELPPNVAIRGDMNLGYSVVSGTVTPVTNDFTHWINGVVTNHAVSSVCNLVAGGRTDGTGYLQGDKCYVAYIKGPGAGSFDLQYESSLAVGTWTTLATIDTSNATTIGAYSEYSLPETNWPFFRLRITNVTGKTLIRIGAGIYASDGGGGMLMTLGNQNGYSPSQGIVSSEILTPIWTGLAPDMVVSCFREDDETQWNVGGAFNDFYLATKAIKPETDWLLVGMHPSNDETYYAAMTTAQKAWATRNKESWFNPYNLFRDYATALAYGMMGDVIHLSNGGNLLRNHALWQDQAIGRFPLGGFVGGSATNTKLLSASSRPGILDSQAVICPVSFGIRPQTGSLGEFEHWDATAPNDFRKVLRTRMINNSYFFKIQNEDVYEISFRYAKFMAGVALAKAVATATRTVWHWEPTIMADATAGALTLNLGSTSAQLDGRIHILKKIDASANAVTVDPNGAETIEGAATVTLANQWDYVVIQSHGGNWIKIGGNV
jgi:hypothetical protein